MDQIIYFYSPRFQYGVFSNYASYSFSADGLYWKTSEHYFKAQKFVENPEYFNRIYRASSPSEASYLGRDRRIPMRYDWEFVKNGVMKKALLAKFRQNKIIKNELLLTNGKQLVEKTSSDYYWGCGSNKTGRNMLRKLLMDVRDQLLLE